MRNINFPKLSKEKLIERLEHPDGITRVIIDTDTANEIDDQLYDRLSFMPFLWRNYLYILTYHFAIYRIADKGKLA